tara:strand:- start:3439 stop:3798 length:360 start_codon:yes stop_codon:yes gene_type:complete
MGCFIYLEEDPRNRDHQGGDFYNSNVWMDYPYIHCSYDAYWDLSEWYFEIYADSAYGPYEVSYVGFEINNYDYQDMEYLGDGLWARAIVSNYYDCDRAYHFDFVAGDYDGYEGYYTYYW